MRKLKLYLDTSVISHLDAPDRPDRMEDTFKLWEMLQSGVYNVILSSVDFMELAKCSEEKRAVFADFLTRIQYRYVDITDEMLKTAEHFISMKILTRKSFVDCQHIAAAIHSGCDLVVSWNFQHMVNIRVIKGAKIITTIEGHKDVLICSPNMLIEGGFSDEVYTGFEN